MNLNSSSDQTKSYQKNAGAHQPCKQKVIEYYNSWSIQYENDLNVEIYRGPKICANFCAILLTNTMAKILDIGAGTGFVGERLAKLGFKFVDALEPAKGMVSVAKAKNVYKNFYIEPIHANRCTSIPAGVYDACVTAGALGEGHIPCEGIREFARVTRSGGLVVIVMRKEYLSTVEDYKGKLEPLMQRMCDEEAVWSWVARIEVPNYSFDKTGVVYCFRKN